MTFKPFHHLTLKVTELDTIATGIRRFVLQDPDGRGEVHPGEAVVRLGVGERLVEEVHVGVARAVGVGLFERAGGRFHLGTRLRTLAATRPVPHRVRLPRDDAVTPAQPPRSPPVPLTGSS